MLPSPRYRTMAVPENADEGSVLRVPCNTDRAGNMPEEAYEDALDHTVEVRDPVADWRCRNCAQKWPAEEFACGYCGRERDD